VLPKALFGTATEVGVDIVHAGSASSHGYTRLMAMPPKP